MIEKPDATALMAGPLGEWLAAQAAARGDAKAKARKYTFYGIVGAVVLGTLALVITQSVQATAIAAGISFAIGGGLAQVARKKVTDQIKGEINGAIAKALGLDFNVNVTPGESFTRAKTYGLLPTHDDDHFEDLWWGVLGGRPFTLHEAKLTEEQGSGDSRRTVTVFEGSILQIGFARRFNGVTLLERQGNRTGFWGGEREKIKVGGLELTRCDMADPTFEDRFTVWSNDAVEGRYLVHPNYMERLVAVEQAFSGDKLRALFLDGDLTIVLESGNLFESGSLEAGQDQALLARTIDQFATVAELATRLNERERGSFN